MKKLIVALVLSFTATAALASCPPFQPYGCHPVGGKMQCGCGQ